MSGLKIRGVSKSFGDQLVLDQVDLEIPNGSIVAALGPSGGGKTTLLRIIAGFLDADAGSISLGGTSLVTGGRGIPPQHRGIGYVPQEGALFPHLNVAANIAFGVRRRGFDVDEMLELVDLDPSLKRRFPHELSGGQQQRVALARALAPRPSMVLMDEPFSSLDAGLRVETGKAVIRALRAADATAILVTHDQDEALALADQVAVMRDGRVAQLASPEELYRAPVDAAVAGFVGSVVILPAAISGQVASTPLGDISIPAGTSSGTAQVLVRPEQLVLGTAGVRAIVEDVSFFGHDATVRLILVDSALTVEARVPGTDVPAVGDAVGISIRGTGSVLGAAPQ
ncbi:iron(III) transport system ATP-binding protein [Aeromicrobium panaciterrae]|uniref:Iron(III) transport system ATP-binding protein n=1 Tax=Aeromicrobium panaciterrae TaxID=363861 RepID=A0ABU1UL40_9ACTN|nr:ABC transporter ATP-binding protein [Aeromicrobium panaciterrae]MDR7085865.1 iron(III) transport system ATP-binding protein [Aeromicrobium panaciterrae]